MNYVLIVADDLRADLFKYIKAVEQWEASGDAVVMRNGFNENPVCIPSRCSILTGNASDTTGIYGNEYPFEAFDDSRTIAVALRQAGYATAHIGKYINNYNDVNASYIPPGWDRWWAITNHGSAYYNYEASNQGTLQHYGDQPHEYMTDVIARNAERFLANAREPFFAYITPVAPHEQSVAADRDMKFDAEPYDPPPSVNEANVRDKPRWIRDMPLLTDAELNKAAVRRANMIRTLYSFNDLVNGVERTLRSRGILKDTMIVVCSDNGMLFGEHRLTGKSVPYLEATRMPIAIRFQGLNESANVAAMIQTIDIAPTFARMAGVDFPCDGTYLFDALFDGGPSRKYVFNQHHAQGKNKPAYITVQGKRWSAHGDTPRWSYTLLGTGEEELYNLHDDPLQMRNVVEANPETRREMRAAARERFTKLPPGMEGVTL